jgi:hypothetical protein
MAVTRQRRAAVRPIERSAFARLHGSPPTAISIRQGMDLASIAARPVALHGSPHTAASILGAWTPASIAEGRHARTSQGRSSFTASRTQPPRSAGHGSTPRSPHGRHARTSQGHKAVRSVEPHSAPHMAVSIRLAHEPGALASPGCRALRFAAHGCFNPLAHEPGRFAHAWHAQNVAKAIEHRPHLSRIAWMRQQMTGLSSVRSALKQDEMPCRRRARTRRQVTMPLPVPYNRSNNSSNAGYSKWIFPLPFLAQR